MTTRRVFSGREYALLWRFPSPLLAHLEPGVMVDVGACWGEMTMALLEASPSSQAVAYEPFPGNQAALGKALGSDARVTLRPVAVGAHAGRAMFCLSSIIDEGPFAGASRVGKLGADFLHKSVAQSTVEVVTLDAEIHEHVRFLKIDVQGGERDVLMGARALIARHGIDLIYVEFRGDWRVLNLLHGMGYVILDCAYTIWPHRGWLPGWPRQKLPDWPLAQPSSEFNDRSRDVWPSVPWRGFAAYCAWFWWQRLFNTGLQTDLLCVHQDFWVQFESAARQAG